MEQYEDTDQLVDPSDSSKGYMIQANFAPRTGSHSFMRHYLCATCGLEYREDEVSFVNKRPYCVKPGHADDAILRRSK